MSDDVNHELPRVLSRRERADAVTKALGDAARRSRLSKKHKQHLAGGYLSGRQNQRAFALFKRVTFVTLFLMPCLFAAAYFGFIASDQYVAETHFTIRGGRPPKLDTIGALTGLPSVLIMQDTEIISNYVRSRDMVDRLDRTLALKSLYSNPSIDYLSRLSADNKIERFVKYWASMVDISVKMPAGIVEVRVRAFTADDAKRIADAVLLACEDLVNNMNERLVRDTMSVSDRQLQRAEDNLTNARTQLEGARNREGLLSAEKTSEALNGLLVSVRSQLAEMQQEYESQSRYVRDDTPQIRILKIRMSAANEEIDKLQAHLTQSTAERGVTPLSGAMSRLDYLDMENKVAERLYASSLALLEHARLAAEAKLLYLNVFVRPALAEDPKFPRRVLDLSLFVASAWVFWYLFVQLCAILRSKVRIHTVLKDAWQQGT